MVVLKKKEKKKVHNTFILVPTIIFDPDALSSNTSGSIKGFIFTKELFVTL